MLNDGLEIRKRAYEIWQAEGQVHGSDLSHWLRAQEELNRTNSAETRLPRRTTAKRRGKAAARSARH